MENELVKAIQQLATHDWFDWISMLSGVIIPILVIFVQRFIDNKRQEKDNQPVIALGSFNAHDEEFQIGKYYDSDIEISSSNTFESNIKIPLYNIGQTPISNVQVSYEIEKFEYLVSQAENEPLYISEIPELYVIPNHENKLEYTLFKSGKSNTTGYLTFEAGKTIMKPYNGKVKKIKTADTKGLSFLSPMTSGSEQKISLNSNIEMLVQYTVFMNAYRFWYENIGETEIEIPDTSNIDWKNPPNTIPMMKQKGGGVARNAQAKQISPVIRFTVKFDDYNQKSHQKELYMRLITGSWKHKHNFSSKGNTNNLRVQWMLVPMTSADVEKYLKEENDD